MSRQVDTSHQKLCELRHEKNHFGLNALPGFPARLTLFHLPGTDQRATNHRCFIGKRKGRPIAERPQRLWQMKIAYAAANALLVAELCLALFRESGHAFGLIFRGKERLEDPPFVIQAFGKRRLIRAVDCVLCGEGGDL